MSFAPAALRMIRRARSAIKEKETEDSGPGPSTLSFLPKPPSAVILSERAQRASEGPAVTQSARGIVSSRGARERRICCPDDGAPRDPAASPPGSQRLGRPRLVPARPRPPARLASGGGPAPARVLLGCLPCLHRPGAGTTRCHGR